MTLHVPITGNRAHRGAVGTAGMAIGLARARVEGEKQEAFDQLAVTFELPPGIVPAGDEDSAEAAVVQPEFGPAPPVDVNEYERKFGIPGAPPAPEAGQ